MLSVALRNSLSNKLQGSLSASLPLLFSQHRELHNPVRIRGKGPAQRAPDRVKKASKFAAYVESLKPLANKVIPLAEVVIERPVVNLKMEPVGSIRLVPDVFDQPLRKDIVKRVVDWHRAKRRQGTHKTLDRSEVSGSGKKPHPQKGTGKARASTRRAPHMRGGGHAFAKRPRDYSFSLPKKVVSRSLKITLSAKLKEGSLMIVDSMALESHKTKSLIELISQWNAKKILFIYDDSELDPNFALAARNIPNFDLMPQKAANTYDVLRHTNLVFTRSAIESLQTRLSASDLSTDIRIGTGSAGGGLSVKTIDWIKIRQERVAKGLPINSLSIWRDIVAQNKPTIPAAQVKA